MQLQRTETGEQLRRVRACLMFIRANGGWKFRQPIKASDLEVQRGGDTGQAYIAELSVRLSVAERLLGKFCPRCGYERWGEYEEAVEAEFKRLQLAAVGSPNLDAKGVAS